MRDFLSFYVNGTKKQLSGAEAFLTLSDYLRSELGQTGTKVVCAEGDCGACTVMVDRPCLRGQSTEPEFKAVNSCILPMALLDGAHIVTVEGLSEKGQPEVVTEVQAKMMEHQGGQCGFCTPGFVMALTAMFEQTDGVITEKKAKNYLTGNLCRCTGYAPILEAALAVDRKKLTSVGSRFGSPQDLAALRSECAEPFCVSDGDRKFSGPKTVAQAIALKSDDPTLRVFGSATDLGVQVNKGRLELTQSLTLHGIEALYPITEDENEIRIGARASLSEVENYLEKSIPEFSEFLHIFASPQIKNGATLGGNIMNGSPIGDTLPFLSVVGAVLDFEGPAGKRAVPIRRFYLGYKKMDVLSGELLVAIRIPKLKTPRFLRNYKVSQRRDLDISAVNASFYGQLKDQKIEFIRIAYGGVGPIVLRAEKTEAFLTGKSLKDAATLAQAVLVLGNEITPISDFRGSKEFRLRISENLLRKFSLEIFGEATS